MTENILELPGDGGGDEEEQEGGITEEHKTTLSGDTYVHYLHRDGDFTGTFTGHNSANCIL